MKQGLLAGLAMWVLACGSNSSAPTEFPSLSGVWSGTIAVTMAFVNHGQSVTEVCNSTWTNTQSGATFSGSMSLGSSTATNAATCGGVKGYTGTVTTAGAVGIPNLNNWPLSDVSWNGVALNDATCGLKTISVPMAGTVSGRAWTMTQQDSWLCLNQSIEVDRTFLVQLTQ